MNLLLILVASAAFGGAWWGLSKLGAHVFAVAALSFLLAELVLASGTLLGFKL